jgi:hypothetical protein
VGLGLVRGISSPEGEIAADLTCDAGLAGTFWIAPSTVQMVQQSGQ